MQISNLFVVAMGICTVFVVLILIIALCSLLSLIFRHSGTEEKSAAQDVPAANQTITNRAALTAAIAAAVAEYSGTDASALRILSIKKI